MTTKGKRVSEMFEDSNPLIIKTFIELFGANMREIIDDFCPDYLFVKQAEGIRRIFYRGSLYEHTPLALVYYRPEGLRDWKFFLERESMTCVSHI